MEGWVEQLVRQQEERGAGQPAILMAGWPIAPAWDGPPVDTGVPYNGDAPSESPLLGGASAKTPERLGREREKRSMNLEIFFLFFFQVIQIQYPINFYLFPSHNKKNWLHFP